MKTSHKLALGLLAIVLLIVGYLWYKGKSIMPAAGASVTESDCAKAAGLSAPKGKSIVGVIMRDGEPHNIPNMIVVSPSSPESKIAPSYIIITQQQYEKYNACKKAAI